MSVINHFFPLLLQKEMEVCGTFGFAKHIISSANKSPSYVDDVNVTTSKEEDK